MRSLNDSLAVGKTLFGAWCTLPEPAIAGALAQDPRYAAISVDLQHGAFDLASAGRTVPLVVGAGKALLARIPVGEFWIASRLLDAGASGIIAPMIEGADDARAFAAFAKFPPIGKRSWGPQGALGLSGLSPADYLRSANRSTIAWAMVETSEALGNLDAILAVDGIEGVFIGPSDLSIALSNGAVLDPRGAEVNAAIDHALARARSAGKWAGIFAPTGERASEFARLGYDFVSVGSDLAFLRAGSDAMASAALG